MVSRSDFLFARPSFLEGMARIWDFTNSLNTYNYSADPKAADEIAIRSDWESVGDSLWWAMSRHGSEETQSTE